MKYVETCQCSQRIFLHPDGWWFHELAPEDYEHDVRPMTAAEEQAIIRDEVYDAR